MNEAFQRLVGEIFRLNGSLLAAGEHFGRDLEISPARWQTIATLRHGAMTVAQISRQLGLARQSVQRTVNLLIDEGLVVTRTNPAHRRAYLVALTSRGRTMMETLGLRQALLAAAFTGTVSMTAEDLDRIAADLRALREAGQQLTQ
jgi:DNA-binding MarR family transcriptional regulator